MKAAIIGTSGHIDLALGVRDRLPQVKFVGIAPGSSDEDAREFSVDQMEPSLIPYDDDSRAAWRAVKDGLVGEPLLITAQKSYKLGTRHLRRHDSVGGDPRDRLGALVHRRGDRGCLRGPYDPRQQGPRRDGKLGPVLLPPGELGGGLRELQLLPSRSGAEPGRGQGPGGGGGEARPFAVTSVGCGQEPRGIDNLVEK
jgi:hypothetical protein